MEIWQAPEGRRWRCEPCSWVGEETTFHYEELSEAEGPPLTLAFCPRCGRAMHPTVEH